MSRTRDPVAEAMALVALHEALDADALALDEILDRAAATVSDLLHAGAALWFREEEQVVLAAFHHPDAEAQAHLTASLGTRHALSEQVGRMTACGQVVHVGADELAALTPTLDPVYQGWFARYGGSGLVVVPLRSRGQHLGAVGVTRPADAEAFDDADVAFLQQVGRVVALAVSNATLLSEIGAAQLRARMLAREDEVTGLLNRRGFLEVLRERVGAHVGASLVAVLDVDGFKLVNDGFGHTAGDMVLGVLAARLCAALDPSAPVARIGGDEFAVLLEGADAAEVGAHLQALVASCHGSIQVVGLTVPLAVSVGTAVPTAERPDDALLQADLAMYRAKQATRKVSGATVTSYDQRLDDPATRRLREVLDLRREITAGDLVVHYQPVVPVGEGPLRAEALVRRRVDGRLLAPDAWLQLADRAGLMDQLTASVLDQVVAQLALWWGSGLEVECAVNVPAPSLTPEVVGTLLAQLDAAGLPRRALSFEVTEGDLVGPAARAALDRCEAADIAVAVDDFGTGWSALSYLVDLPLRTVKLDRSFVTGIDADVRRAAVVRAVVEVAHELGLRVVAEGVETAAVADVVIGLGADAIQGYLYCRPAAAEQVEAVLRAGLVAVRS